ncbi:hypothetical protein VB735_34085 [Halotia wernerae UHCC 0503]|nr:hypothetical protein [Halotia wernerae UHCC 0503]
MAHVMTTVLPLQADDWGECCEKILLPPTNPNAEIVQISGYKLVYVNGACPRIYRVYKTDSMIGLVFQHITYWSNEVDKIQYAKPLNAVIGLDDFMKLAGKSRASKSLAA